MIDLQTDSEFTPFIKDYLECETGTAILVLAKDLTIERANKGFRRHLNMLDAHIIGAPIHSFLLVESQALFDTLSQGEHRSFSLSFAPEQGVVTVLHAHIYATVNHFIIFGEHPVDTHHELIDKMSQLNSELVNAMRELRRKQNELDHAQAEVNTLSGLLPICSNCMKIRDDKGYWNRIETYISQNSKARFTHGVCPVCIEKLYPGLDLDEPLE